MGSLVRRISGESGIGYGINILQVQPPGAVQGVSTNVVGVLAELPWGPVGVLTTVTSTAEFLETFYPSIFGSSRDSETYPALRAFLNKAFPGGLRVVRVDATSAAKASKTFADASAGDSVTVTAGYQGVLGNEINVAWEANADDATARDAIVTIGSSYSKRHKAVATIVDSALVVTDPGEDHYTFAKASGATLVPAAITATALENGADGTAVAADYTGSSDEKGIEAFEGASADHDIFFVAECPAALVDSVNAKIKTYAASWDGVALLSTTDDQSSADAQTYVASYRDEGGVMCWPRVTTKDWFDANAPTVEVDGNAFYAAVLANLDPWFSPGGKSGAEFLKGIVGLENEATTDTTYEALNDAGISPFFMSSSLGGAIIRRGVTTSLSPGKEKVLRRRMFTYLTVSMANLAEHYVDRPLDLDLNDQILGPETGGLVAAWKTFLQDLQDRNRIRSYTVDPFASNTQTNIDDGRWYVDVRVKLMSSAEEIVMLADIGEGVTIAS